ncbi:MAG: DUF1853 family protein [Sneathiella sp.]|nr:DUF1853 family protein [Sneathiella sp.]
MASSANIAEALEWVITSPFLLKGKVEPDLWSLPESQELITRVRHDPAPLNAYLAKRKRKNLGSLFEYLTFYWLENLPDVRVIGHNLQLRDEKNTYGEIDLLFEYAGHIYQWELAIKFYACDGTPEDEANWLGPLRRDNLKRKLDRLLDFQLHHLNEPYAQTLLSDLGISDRPIQCFPFVKGCLYSPHSSTEIILPPRLAPDGLHGKWLPLHHLDSYLSEWKISHFAILTKADWLNSVPDDKWQATEMKLTEALNQIFNENPTPRQVALKAGDVEIARPFIMPDSWSSLPRV